MVLDNSFDDIVFSFVENSMNVSCAAKLIEDKYAILDRNNQANNKHNSFPLFAIVCDNLILMFFFKFYISKQNNEMYLEFEGISQKNASKYVSILYNGIATVSLNNAKEEIEKYLIDEYIPYTKEILKNTG